MKNIFFISLTFSIFLLFGCGSKVLFKEDFDSYSGSVQIYPSGPPDDIIKTVGGPPGPIVDNNHRLVFTPPSGTAKLISDNYSDSDNAKTIYWEGNFSLADGPMWFIISAGNSSGDIGNAPHLKMTIWSNEVILEEYVSTSNEFQQLQDPADISNVHNVFISLRPKSMSYHITISSSLPQIVWPGSLTPEFVNHIKNNSRILVHAIYPNEAAPAKYFMDDIIMREKK